MDGKGHKSQPDKQLQINKFSFLGENFYMKNGNYETKEYFSTSD